MLSARLKILRKEKGFRQDEVARELKIGLSTYGYYEQGKSVPSAATLDRLASYYGVSTDYLLGKSEFRNARDESDFSAELYLTKKTVEGLQEPREYVKSVSEIASRLQFGQWLDPKSLESAVQETLAALAFVLDTTEQCRELDETLILPEYHAMKYCYSIFRSSIDLLFGVLEAQFDVKSDERDDIFTRDLNLDKEVEKLRKELALKYESFSELLYRKNLVKMEKASRRAQEELEKLLRLTSETD